MASATVAFGDGSSTTVTGACTALLPVSHAYRHGGDFTITVTAVSGCDPAIPVDLSTATATVHVYPAAPAAASRWPTCSTYQLHMSGVNVGAAAGNVADRITLQNRSSTGCTLMGYPTIQLIAPDGRLLPTNSSPATTGAYTFPAVAPHLVAIAPNAYASFEIASVDNPFGPNADRPYAVACPSSTLVRVTLPGTHQFGTAAVPMGACNGAVWVSPILPGSDGVTD